LFFSCRGGSYNVDDLCDAVALQLDYPAVAANSGAAKRASLLSLLSKIISPVFLLVDNFESLGPQQEEVYRFLRSLPMTIRIIVTSSERHEWMSAIEISEIPGLTEAESIEFIRRKLSAADTRTPILNDEEVLRRIHSATAGNPLAMEWIIGQVKGGFVIDSVLSQLESGVYDKISAILFDETWKRLTNPSRQLLCWMVLFPIHAPLVLLQEISGYNNQQYQNAISELIRYQLISLQSVDGLLGSRIRIHSLVARYVFYIQGPINGEMLESVALAYDRFLRKYLEARAGSKAVAEVERELPNLIPLVERLYDIGKAALGVQVTYSIVDYLNLFGLYDRRRRLSELAIDYLQNTDDSDGMSAVLTIQAGSLFSQGRMDDAAEAARQSVAFAERANSASCKARALRILGLIVYAIGHDDEARICLKEAWPLAREAKDVEIQVELCFLEANLALSAGVNTTARESMEHALTLASEIGWKRPNGYAAGVLARTALEENDIDSASEEIKRGITVANEFLDRRLYARVALLGASLAARQGKFITFSKLTTELMDILDRLGLQREMEELKAQLNYWTMWRQVKHSIRILLTGNSITPVRYSPVRLDGV